MRAFYTNRWLLQRRGMYTPRNDQIAMQLTTKLILALTFLSAGVLSSTMGLLYVSERRHLLAQLEQGQLKDIEKLARVCA
ncbi:MAG: hypothetical protein AAB262_08990, partial [Elusimicrobiota bacterium]